jgi:hypothetical protein
MREFLLAIPIHGNLARCYRNGDEFMEWIKDLSDRFLIWFLRVTSRFERELTNDGRKEQILWREQRMRNLEGLSLRSRQRYSDKSEPV